MSLDPTMLYKVADKLGIGGLKQHIILCAGEKCCGAEAGQKTWDWLKEWSRSDEAKAAGVYRTKASCLRVCRDGPLAVVYPDGTWYHSVSPEVCERIVKEHVLGGKPVKEFIFAENPLSE